MPYALCPMPYALCPMPYAVQAPESREAVVVGHGVSLKMDAA